MLERSGVFFTALSPSAEIIFEFRNNPMLETAILEFSLVWVLDFVVLPDDPEGLTPQLKTFPRISQSLKWKNDISHKSREGIQKK
jgi:hypothetical protein